MIAGYEFNSSTTAGFNASSSSVENPPPSFPHPWRKCAPAGRLQGYADGHLHAVDRIGLHHAIDDSDSASAVLFLLQAGYAADRVMNPTLDLINGINNESRRRVGAARPADPRFVRLGKLINEMQVAGDLEVRILRPQDAAETSVMIFRPGTKSPELEAKRLEIAEILGVRPTADEIKVFYGGYSGRNDEIAMLTRSMLQIMVELGFFADVPAGDVAAGRASPSQSTSVADDACPGPLHIMSGEPAAHYDSLERRRWPIRKHRPCPTMPVLSGVPWL